MCRDEALALSALGPQLTSAGVPLVGVVHETLGVDEFRKFFVGSLYLDTEKHFYGPKERRMLLLGFLRLQSWVNIYKSRQKGTPGNLKGDGTLLGGVYVLGPGDEGVLFEHREGTFGDHASTSKVLEAVAKINKRL